MMVAVACFCDQYEIDRQTVLTTLMVTTSYDEAVPARTAFFVYIRCRSICDNYTNLVKSAIVRL